MSALFWSRRALCAPLIALAGCAATSPAWESTFGDAARQLRAQQTLDRDAPTRNAQSAPPADGRTTREAMDRHVESYRSPPPTNVITIGVGGGGNGR